MTYDSFASIYDELMDAVPYDIWHERIRAGIIRYGVSKPVRDAADALTAEQNLVVDLGCGTGTLTELLYDDGYDMIGIDNSSAMLAVAMEKKEAKEEDILYLQQDMRELELYSTVGTVVSVCDCLNYILEPDELADVFKLVNNYLFPGGLFLFDFNTDYKYREVIGDTTIAENRADCSFIWENTYDEESKINEYAVTFFLREDDGRYRKETEYHYQRGYSFEEMRTMGEKAGLSFVEAIDADTGGEVTDTTERIFMIMKECSKKSD